VWAAGSRRRGVRAAGGRRRTHARPSIGDFFANSANISPSVETSSGNWRLLRLRHEQLAIRSDATGAPRAASLDAQRRGSCAKRPDEGRNLQDPDGARPLTGRVGPIADHIRPFQATRRPVVRVPPRVERHRATSAAPPRAPWARRRDRRERVAFSLHSGGNATRSTSRCGVRGALGMTSVRAAPALPTPLFRASRSGAAPRRRALDRSRPASPPAASRPPRLRAARSLRGWSAP